MAKFFFDDPPLFHRYVQPTTTAPASRLYPKATELLHYGNGPLQAEKLMPCNMIVEAQTERAPRSTLSAPNTMPFALAMRSSLRSSVAVTRCSVARLAAMNATAILENRRFYRFTADNLGVPRNSALPFYAEDQPDAAGYAVNRLGARYVDDGVGAFLRARTTQTGNGSNWRSHIAASSRHRRCAMLISGRVRISSKPTCITVISKA